MEPPPRESVHHRKYQKALMEKLKLTCKTQNISMLPRAIVDRTTWGPRSEQVLCDRAHLNAPYQRLLERHILTLMGKKRRAKINADFKPDTE